MTRYVNEAGIESELPADLYLAQSVDGEPWYHVGYVLTWFSKNDAVLAAGKLHLLGGMSRVLRELHEPGEDYEKCKACKGILDS